MNAIRYVYADQSLKDFGFAEKTAEKSDLPLEIRSKESLIEEHRSMSLQKSFEKAKQTLFITEKDGRFLKKCPGSKGVVCCNYYTINSASGCPFDCSYCILQYYIRNNPFISVFQNREKVFDEIKDHLQTHRHIRVGTGELADSLALDSIIDESGFYLSGLQKYGLQDKVTFEFKTKSACINPLIQNLEKYPGSDIVAGFSLNIPEFSRSDENLTASVEERLKAVEILSKTAAGLAFHFDPVLMLDEFLPSYIEIIDRLLETVPHRKIRWISLGGFRMPVDMKKIIRRRFPDSLLLSGEMFPSDEDHKTRYLSLIRKKFYQTLIQRIKSASESLKVYLCMEKNFIWQDSFPNYPEILKGNLNDIFCSSSLEK